jgi:hypothetical protein
LEHTLAYSIKPQRTGIPMPNNQKLRLLTLIFAMSVLLLTACRHTSDEAQIRQSIASMEQAAEEGSADGVGAWLSDDFDGNAGELDRRALTGMVRLMVLRGEHAGATIGPVSVEHRGERLVAIFTVTLTRRSGRLLPDQLGIYQVESAWRKEQGKWLCYNATWKHSI